MDIDIDALRRHIGRQEIDHDVATAAPLAGMAVTFERPEPPPREGEPVPPGWHWAYFWAMSPRRSLGADGLPTEGGVLPPMPFPRRMFAGARFAFHRPLRVGDRLRRETELTDITARQGATGTLIFTTVTQRIFGSHGLALVEAREGVFREAGAPSAVRKPEPPPPDTPWRRTVTPDAVTLFRYSALTFNPHRIHYDRPYAMGVEGYPGLVVHGPFTQQCLIDLARDHHPGRVMTGFAVRARAPLFDTAPFTVVGRPAGANACEVWAVTPEGGIAMSATASFA